MKIVGFVLCGIILCSLQVQAKVRKDTIYTTDGDRIILTYEITHSTNQTTINFIGQQKRLSRKNLSKYKDLSKVAVMFFDRTGNYDKNLSIDNMVPEAFMTPSGVQCQKSVEGFYLIPAIQRLYESECRLNFKVQTETSICIPIYLAYKPKRRKYILFSMSKELKIPIGKVDAKQPKLTTQTVEQTITSTSEIEADNTATINVLESIRTAKDLISETNRLPFSETLLDEISYLRQKKRELTDKSVLSEISDVLDRYEAKKKFLEDESAEEQMALSQAEERRAREEAQSIKAQNDSIAAAQKQASEEEKKRNLWMVVGGIILAGLAFVGNQVFQDVRNKRSQMRMMNMQQSIANRAEAEAKRRARNAIRSQKNKIINGTKQKASEAIRKTYTVNVKGKSKNPSI